MQKIEIPTTCPCCSYKLEMVNEQLFCRNLSCEAQLGKKLEHFTKTLGIKGFGPKTIEKLGLADITELFYLDKASVVEALGSEKVTDKLLDEIERAKGADLATVLASFSIPLVGGTASKKIASVVSSIEEITQETCKQAGLGDKVTSNLLNWISMDYPEMKEFLPFSFKSSEVKSVNTSGPTICITGKLASFKTKSEATKILEAAGFIVVESVTKTLKYLVDEDSKGSTKRKKAEEYGVTIVTNLTDFVSKF
jgi:NAD-dependent DNA ligase